MRFLASALAALLFCASPARAGEAQPFVLLASTIGPIDAGIVEALEVQFEKDTGIQVRHVGAGTGAALDMARRGGVDLLLVHARSLEEKFVAEGYGTERIPLMYNDFVLVGPASDPAGIRGKGALEALKLLAAKGQPFLTRGDNSGTHVAEKELWAKAGLKPSGPWYQVFEKGSQGNVPTLLHADALGVYTFIDRATWLSVKGKLHLAILVEGDETLINHISLIPVAPGRFKDTNTAAAKAFADWLTDPAKGQKLISLFGADRHGSPLFVPESKAWKARDARK